MLLTSPGVGQACGFIDSAKLVTTFREEVAASKLVLYGKVQNSQGTPAGGTTEFAITGVIKSHPILGDRKVVVLSVYYPISDPRNPPRLLLFADVVKKKIDPFRGVVVQPAVVPYLRGLLALDPRDRAKVLHYCFDYLENADAEIARDAFGEFFKVRDDVIGKAAKTMSAKKLRLWLRTTRDPRERWRLYGFLLGNCGEARDASLLRQLLEKGTKASDPPNLDGVFTGYILLKPKEGHAYLRSILADPSRDFRLRIGALRALRFFFLTRPDVLGKKELLEGMKLGLQQGDFADIPIEFLRQWRCWDLTDHILPLYTRKSHEGPLLRQTIVRYALQCPKRQAKKFVALVRKKEPEFVEEMEKSLQPSKPAP
jgi:hypothetical protein